MNVRIVAIAGGTGSGKSTLAINLVTSDPERFALVHLDDYFKKAEQTPRTGSYINWEHPTAVRFDDLIADLNRLREGKLIQVRTKSELYHPGYDPYAPNKISHQIEPKPVILLEGYLVLYDARVRELCDARIYLSMPIEESRKRRSKNKAKQDEEYYQNILIPSHRTFVEPTREYATLVIDVAGKTQGEVLSEAYEHIEELVQKAK